MHVDKKEHELRIEGYSPTADGKVDKAVLKGLLKMKAEYKESNTSEGMFTSEIRKEFSDCCVNVAGLNKMLTNFFGRVTRINFKKW